MSNKPRRDQPRVSRSLPHSSWNLDRPILFAARDPAAEEHRAGERRRVTPDDIWAIVDAAK